MSGTGTLGVTTPSEREIEMTRVFDAPRKLVFDALTKPELVQRWLGARDGWSMPVCEIDLKVGGAYRYVWCGPDGSELGMGGVFHEIVTPERVVATEKFDDAWYPGEALDTTVLDDQDGKTRLTLTVRYESQEARDAVLQTPMASGMAAMYDRLDEYLSSIA